MATTIRPSVDVPPTRPQPAPSGLAAQVGNYIIPIESGLVPVPSGAIPKKCNVAIVGAGAGEPACLQSWFTCPRAILHNA